MVERTDGPFLYGEESTLKQFMRGFWIDRYLVTNSQYAKLLNTRNAADLYLCIRVVPGHSGLRPQGSTRSWPNR